MLRGLSSPDDAAVMKLNDAQALVATTDFFAPVVDDPYWFGAIAAANALSDIYAMGGQPTLALNLAGFPKTLDMSILNEILRGGAEKVREAGAVIAGGHTTYDDEPKYGLAVMGMVALDRIFTNGGARPGDQLLLTKPIGTGIVTTALKQQQITEQDAEPAVVSMARLNAGAAKILREAPDGSVHAVTDITGFSLMGHGREMAEQSGVNLNVRLGDVPLLPHAHELAEKGVAPGGAGRNKDYFGEWVDAAPGHAPWSDLVLFDPQTSGGLLCAIAGEAVNGLTTAFAKAGEPVWHLGEVSEGSGRLVIQS